MRFGNYCDFVDAKHKPRQTLNRYDLLLNKLIGYKLSSQLGSLSL